MKQIINYIKLSYKQLLWVGFLMLFFLQFRVYYEAGKFINEILDEKDNLLDVNFMILFYTLVYIPALTEGTKIREKTRTKKSTKKEKIASWVLVIYCALLIFQKRIEVPSNGIFIGFQMFLVTFLVFSHLDRRNKEAILKVLPINTLKRQIAMGIISIIIITISSLSVESVIYVDKVLDSGDLAKFYSGSIKGLFVLFSLLCYRKFNLKKKREEDVTETSVYNFLKDFGGK